MIIAETEKVEVSNPWGVLIVFSKETQTGVRIEIKRPYAIIAPEEARTVARWLLEAADSIDSERESAP